MRLLAWLSPAFPTGGFAYSHGLERAVQDGLAGSAEALADWLATLLEFGSGWNDAVLLAEAWRRGAASEQATDLAELAAALAGSRERHLETTNQGAAFLSAVGAWAPRPGLPLQPSPAFPLVSLPKDCPYPVAIGVVTGAHCVALCEVLAPFLQAFASNLIQAAIRLGVTGQQGGLEILAGLEPLLIRTAERAAASTLDDLGSATLLSDVASMRHEIQHSRLFRS